jgi:hypothetical protein
VVLDSSTIGPALQSWVSWESGEGGMAEWCANDARPINNGSGLLRIVYRWYNSSIVCPPQKFDCAKNKLDVNLCERFQKMIATNGDMYSAHNCAENPRLGAKRNIAAHIARGDIVMNMDDDDV